ncbi:hypothetical protein CW355_00185 [Haemophilus influenzae]|nr:hypothetical protein CW355_00185 [Haemophilus influenzae]
MKAFLHHLQNEAKLIISPTYCVDGEFALSEIARATLQQYGIVQLSSATNSDSETEAATSKAVKTAYDKAVEAKTTADGKVGLNGNESINGEKSFENRIVAKRNIRISGSQHYASHGDHLNIGANNGDCWFEYKSNNREIGTLRIHANGDLTYKRQKIYHAGAKPQFNTDIEGKPNTLAGYGIGNFKVEEFRGNLNTLKTDGIYAITQASRSQNLPVSTSYHIQVIAGSDGAWCRQLAYVAYSTDMYERHQTSQAEDNWSAWVKLNDIEPVRELLSTKANISHTHTVNQITNFNKAVNAVIDSAFTYQKIGDFEIRKYPDGTMIQTGLVVFTVVFTREGTTVHTDLVLPIAYVNKDYRCFITERYESRASGKGQYNWVFMQAKTNTTAKVTSWYLGSADWMTIGRWK